MRDSKTIGHEDYKLYKATNLGFETGKELQVFRFLQNSCPVSDWRCM